MHMERITGVRQRSKAAQISALSRQLPSSSFAFRDFWLQKTWVWLMLLFIFKYWISQRNNREPWCWCCVSFPSIGVPSSYQSGSTLSCLVDFKPRILVKSEIQEKGSKCFKVESKFCVSLQMIHRKLARTMLQRMQVCKEQDYILELSLCSISQELFTCLWGKEIYHKGSRNTLGSSLYWTNTLISRAFLIVIGNHDFWSWD